MGKISKKKRNKIIIISISLFISLLFVLLLVLYFRHIDREVKKITEETSYTYIMTKKINGDNGLLVANIEDDLKEYVKKHKKATTTTYKIDDETFSFQVNIFKSEDEFKIEIDKIVDQKRNISARMTYKNVKRINYITDTRKDVSVLNIITDYDNKYLILTKNNYYFLGTDINKISFDSEHFYYYSYNENYMLLETESSCSYDVINEIENFNYNDYYYTYGIVNFLEDYYQKLSPSTYSVWNRCEDLKNREKVVEE